MFGRPPLARNRMAQARQDLMLAMADDPAQTVMSTAWASAAIASLALTNGRHRWRIGIIALLRVRLAAVVQVCISDRRRFVRVRRR